MELLQKLTLYDLFGYTIPGVLAVWLFMYGGDVAQMDSLTLGSLGLLIILGYVAGALITEVAERMEWVIEWVIGWFFKMIHKVCGYSGKGYWERICDDYKISKEMIICALDKAKVKGYDPADSAAKLAEKYATYMYSEIQTDPVYDRLDTYASAELLYKNMCLVSLIAAGMGWRYQQNSNLIFGLAGVIFFAIRRVRFAERSKGYTLCWFVQKYEKK